MVEILWAVLIAAVAVWGLGLLLDFGGPMIHALLGVAAALLIYNLVIDRPDT